MGGSLEAKRGVWDSEDAGSNPVLHTILIIGAVMEQSCWVCNGLSEPPNRWKAGGRCEEHDVCDTCKLKRKDIVGIPWGTKDGFRCQACEQARKKKAISLFSEEKHNNIDFEYNTNPLCPYCGRSFDANDECEDYDIDCPNCDSPIHVSVDISIDYSTTKIIE